MHNNDNNIISDNTKHYSDNTNDIIIIDNINK